MRWNEWSRKFDGWVERRRRVQKTGAQTEPLAGQETPAGAVAAIPTRGSDGRSSLETPPRSGTASLGLSDGGRP